MTLSNIIKLKTNDGLEIVDFLVEVMHDRYEDFQICHRLQAAKLLTTYGNEDAPSFIDDNPQEPRSNRNGRKPQRPTKFDTELARVIKQDTGDGRSIARFLVNAMAGEFKSFKPHHRMSAARELLDRGFGKSARAEKTTQQTPSPGGEGWGESLPRTRSGGEIPALVHPNPTEAPELSTNKIREIPESDESEFRHPTNQITESQLTQLTNDIRDDLPYLHPDDFDETLYDFLENIGDIRSNYLQYIGDEVTEGVIDRDPVGLDRIHFRAKLSINPIDELEIRDFSGSLDRRDAATGMFITTSDFTEVARRVAEMVSAEDRPIRLVDGSELARYLASLKMGITPDIPNIPRKLDENHPNEHT